MPRATPPSGLQNQMWYVDYDKILQSDRQGANWVSKDEVQVIKPRRVCSSPCPAIEFIFLW
jgi:hypothetical protein